VAHRGQAVARTQDTGADGFFDVGGKRLVAFHGQIGLTFICISIEYHDELLQKCNVNNVVISVIFNVRRML
jgi:hypothetical protein